MSAHERNGDGVVVDIQAKVVDNVPVTAFPSLFESMTQPYGSAHRLAPGRNTRSRKADILGSPIARHGD